MNGYTHTHTHRAGFRYIFFNTHTQIAAQVMLVRNLDLKGGEAGGRGRQLVNGSRGVVVGWAAKVRSREEGGGRGGLGG